MNFAKSPIGITFFSLLFLNCFGIFHISNTILLAILIPFLVWGFNRRSLCFRKILIFLLIGLVISMFSCSYYNGQGILDSIAALASFYYILIYFMLSYIKPSSLNIKKALICLCLIFNTLYILQFILLQKGLVFLPIEEDNIFLGEGARFHMIGSGLASLSIFLGINTFLYTKNKLALFFSFSGLIVLLLMAFRTMVVLSILFVVFELFLIKGVKKTSFIYLIIGGACFFLLLQIPVIYDKVEYMWLKEFGEGTKHSFANEDYIRWVTLGHYYTNHFHDWIEFIFGSGYPNVDGRYFKTVENLWSVGIYWMDWGLLGLSWMIGIPAVFSMLLYSYKVFKIKIDKRFYFIPVWFLYLVISSITTAEFFRQGNFVIQALCLYLAERVYYDYIKNKKYVFNNNTPLQ